MWKNKIIVLLKWRRLLILYVEDFNRKCVIEHDYEE